MFRHFFLDPVNKSIVLDNFQKALDVIPAKAGIHAKKILISKIFLLDNFFQIKLYLTRFPLSRE
ncbi:MAG: hypothetical protein ACEY3D_06710 [Rickettsia sp.]|uniref:hypothetical protein n=1 Tax=Rickettsia sp. TaxID=789 RepID=UPI003978B202